MEAGKDLYVEKPLTVRVAEASDLVQTAKNRGLILMVGPFLRLPG